MKFKLNTLEKASAKLVVTKAKNMSHGEFEAVLSTEDLDRHGEKVSIKGMALPKDSTIKMYYNHETTGTSLPIGKWLKVWKSDGKLMGRGEVDLEDEFAVKIYKKILKGYIDSISVGFYPQEFDGEESTWTKSELVEASVFAEPANTAAVITNKDLDFTEQEFQKSLKVKLKQINEVKDGEDSTDDEDSKDNSVLTTDDIQAEFKNLKTRMGSLEEAVKATEEQPTIKQIIKARVASKEVDKSTERLNSILKVKLKEKN